MNGLTSRRGFTLAELLVVLVVSGILLMVLTRAADVIGRVDQATRSESGAQALESTIDRVLRTAVGSAGLGIPASPNLGGIGVKPASLPDGSAGDTLIVLQADGLSLTAAERSCPVQSSTCLAVHGDQRPDLRPGDLLLVGTRATGLAAMQVTADPTVFHAPCAGECSEALVCPLKPGPPVAHARILGSVRQPSGERSSAPCPHAFFPDGSRCEEIVEQVEGAARMLPECRVVAGTSTFTAIPVADRTLALGFPAPPISTTRSGAGGVPKVRVIRARASRFWIDTGRAGGRVLVRQNSLDPSGAWRRGVPVAAPLQSFRIQALQAGEWVNGVGDANLQPGAGNPNFVRRAVPAVSGEHPAWHFRQGHHTVTTVRVKYVYQAVSSSHGHAMPREVWLNVAARNLRQGGTGDAD